MKISLKLPSAPTVDVLKTPAAPASVPVPVPNLGGSSFAPAGSDERRFSVRFMKALPQRLQLAGLPAGLHERLQARFGAMNRGELDRFGLLAEQLLAGAAPARSLGVFEAFSSLHTAILPGGHRVEPNVDGSWTVMPRGAAALELADQAGARATLVDGTSLAVDRPGVLRAGAQVVDRAVAEAARRVPPEQFLQASLAVGAALSGVPMVGTAVSAVVTAAATTIVASPQLMTMTAQLAEQAGFDALATPLRDGAQHLDALLQTAPVQLVLDVVLLSAAATASPATVKLLEHAGRSAAQSPRADPDLERGLLLLAAAGRAPADALSTLAGRLRGKARDELPALFTSPR